MDTGKRDPTHLACSSSLFRPTEGGNANLIGLVLEHCFKATLNYQADVMVNLLCQLY